MSDRADRWRSGGVERLTGEELLALLAALGHRQRLRIIAELAQGQVHVSALARRLGLSRPLTYMHLDRLEAAGLVSGHLELSDDGKAMKFFALVPFALQLDAALVVEALRSEDETNDETGGGADNPGPLGQEDR